MSQKKKKTNKQLKQDRQISRDKRNLLRKEVIENFSSQTNDEAFHIIFISKETENMERILFNVTTLSNGFLINLPIITMQMIKECENQTYKGIILHHFGIESDNITLVDGTNLLIVKDFRIVYNIKNLIELIVRPYNEYTWYDNNCITTLYGERIFNGKKLKEFFISSNDLESSFVFQDTITEILLYRIKRKKINGTAFLNNYLGRFYKATGIETGNRQKRNNSFSWSTFLSLLAKDDQRLNEILANERNEIDELLSGDDSGPQRLVLQPPKKDD